MAKKKLLKKQEEKNRLFKEKTFKYKEKVTKHELFKISPWTEKACKKCEQVKPLEEYHKKARAADGKQSICKTCVSERNRSLTDYNREYNRKYRVEKSEEVKKYHRDRGRKKRRERGLYNKPLFPGDTKVCNKCDQRKEVSENFCKSNKSLSGYFNTCKSCQKKKRELDKLHNLSFEKNVSSRNWYYRYRLEDPCLFELTDSDGKTTLTITVHPKSRVSDIKKKNKRIIVKIDKIACGPKSKLLDLKIKLNKERQNS